MTLIVYSDQAIYADKAVLHKGGTVDQYLQHGQKLFVDPKNMYAFVMSGQLPHPRQLDNLHLYIRTICRTTALQNETRDEEELKKMDKVIQMTVDKIKEQFGSTIYGITTDSTFMLSKEEGVYKLTYVWDDCELAEGTGRNVFITCRLNDRSIKESYRIASIVDSSISEDFDTYRRRDLTPIVFNEEKMGKIKEALKGMEK